MFQARWLTPILVMLTACSASQTPQSPLAPVSPTTAPTTVPTTRDSPPVPVGERRISGVITERLPGGTTRPLAGANVNAWVDTGTFAYSYMWANGPRTTDSAGHYELTSLPEAANVYLQVYKQGYVQQCASPPAQMTADAAIDGELVLTDNVTASPESIVNKPGFRNVSGRVYEETVSGRRPFAGVFVDYEHAMDSPGATTYSDANGRYLLCGIPDGRAVDIGAGSASRVAYATVPAGQTSGVDLVLR